jgi:single-strand DNA-binding protein
MSRGKNLVILIGNLGADPESKALQSGTTVTNARLAINETYKDKQTGEKKEKVEWVSLVFWSNLADIAAQYLKKGSHIYVEGQIRTRKWQDKEGHDRYSTEVHCNQLNMLGGGKREGGTSEQVSNSGQRAAAPVAEKSFEDDDIPF